jgi:FlaA1/EpsC-like NDP-sugar epimerase
LTAGLWLQILLLQVSTYVLPRKGVCPDPDYATESFPQTHWPQFLKSMKTNPLPQQFLLSRSLYRRVAVLLFQVCLVSFSYYESFLLRFDFDLEPRYVRAFWQTVVVVLGLKLVCFYRAGLFRGWWRYSGVYDVVDISLASGISTIASILIIKFVLHTSPYPRSVLIIDAGLTVLLLSGARFVVRFYCENLISQSASKRALIIGAGEAGFHMSRTLMLNPQLDFKVVGFIDDDDTKQNIKLHGIRILGKVKDLPHVIEEYAIDSAIIAMPSVSGPAIQTIVEICSAFKIDLKILPKLSDRLGGISAWRQVRGVKVEDLLGRKPIRLDSGLIQERFRDGVVLITGAGGSIGSELSRQLGGVLPQKLLLFERSENDLHKIHLEMCERFPNLTIVPIVGDILDVRLLRDVMAEYRPQSVFHAAAYKHVPMMERNCFQAVTNNIFGTYNVALTARQYEARDFVMISSDKAVNPTNIMGVTKRIAELVILSLQHQTTRFIAVRFGNVLGSNGSVLPRFEQQIAKGGPLTLTHPDAKRYFMTIPEAVQLVLQASVMGKGGEIFVLDMGDPIRIVDLAMNLIRLSGLEPEKDIQLVYTGLRPGEKLFEELQLQGEGIKPTPHPKIRVLDGGQPDVQRLRTWLDELSVLTDTKNTYELLRTLKMIVPEYVPSEGLVAKSEFDRHDFMYAYSRQRTGLSFAAD